MDTEYSTVSHKDDEDIVIFDSLCKLNTQRSLTSIQLEKCNQLELSLSSVTEIDLSGVMEIQQHTEQYIHRGLQSLCNVKKLVLNCAGLHSLPTTIGSLGKLEFLSLANNELKTLPVTLQCCRQLRVLDIRWNSFEYCIPPVLLRLSRLESLEHSKTGQLATYHDKSDGSYTWWKEGHHFTWAYRSPWLGPYAEPHVEKPQLNIQSKPNKLQVLCAGAIFREKLDYWHSPSIGIRQRKILDQLAIVMDLCAHCHQPILLPGKFSVEMLLINFVGTYGKARVKVCSETCQRKVIQDYIERDNIISNDPVYAMNLERINSIMEPIFASFSLSDRLEPQHPTAHAPPVRPRRQIRQPRVQTRPISNPPSQGGPYQPVSLRSDKEYWTIPCQLEVEVKGGLSPGNKEPPPPLPPKGIPREQYRRL